MSKTSNKSKLQNLVEWMKVRALSRKPIVTTYNKQYETQINKFGIDTLDIATGTIKYFNSGIIPNNLKINAKDNTITIKKLKNSWNREEIIDLIKLFANNYQYASNDIGYNKWIEENL